jgi:hypothetical protein
MSRPAPVIAVLGLGELGIPARVARASQHWLEQLLAEAADGPGRKKTGA